ncbi:MAG TPA: lipoyl domain-containing protein [Polyangiaceae bacterium]|jgi:pyruvate dehydrogenase E2 component (dihydrolipoamide acetyltransferase)
MRTRLTLGRTSEPADELRVLEWHLEVGDEFAKNDLLVELETSKSLVEVRAPIDGFLRARLVEAGAWVSLGAVLAIVSQGNDDDADDGSLLPAVLEVV